MLYAYFWACRLSIEELPTSLKDVETRAILIDKIDMPLTVENNTANLLLEYMSPRRKGISSQQGLRYCEFLSSGHTI